MGQVGWLIMEADMARVRVKSGDEGPKHDPYGWTEIQFTTTAGDTVTFRYSGLGYERTTFRGATVETFDGDPTARMWFEELTGMDPDRAESIPDELEARMLRRMSPHDRFQYEAFLDADARLMSYVM
jgi:hypothetical protein